MMVGHLQFRFGLLFLIFYMNIGSAANYDDPPYANSAHHDAMNIYSTMYHHQQQQQQPQQRHNGAQIEQNLQGNSNYQQLYRYYYTPPSYHQQQQQQQQIAPTQLWSGPPIVVEDNANQQSPATVNQPTATRTRAFYDTPTNTEHTLSLARHRNLYTQATPQLHYKNYHNNFNYNHNNNNNNNIVYHRDFRPQIASIPDAEHMQQDDNLTWYERQRQQQHQHSQVEEELRKQQQNEQQQQQPQYYATNTNLHSNGISNDLRKNDLSDYSEHFRRYLENNPHRIKPIY